MAVRNWQIRRNLTVAGSIFLIFPVGLDWSWGSMSIYVLSRVICQQQHTRSMAQAPWIISLFICGWITGLIASGFISRFIKHRWLVLIGIVITNASMSSGYFLVQSSLVMLNIMVGAVYGLGGGLLYGDAIHLVVHVVEEDALGFSLALIGSAHVGGSIFITQIVTWFTNPQNEIPRLEVEPTKYFTQKDVVNRVPYTFFVIAGFSLAVQILGLILLQTNPSMRYVKFCSSGNLSEQTSANEEVKRSDCQAENNSAGRMCIGKNVERETLDGHSLIGTSREPDCTPKELLRSHVFYSLWTSCLMVDIPLIILNNYYKSYGLVWIRDDHFLTYLGTINVFTTAIFRVLVGKALDKLGPRSCLVFLISGLILSVTWFYFAPMIHRWIYFFTTLIVGSFCGASYTCFSASVSLIFGKTHAATNTGLLLSSSLAFNLFAPLVFQAILTNLGWFCLFAGAGALNVVGLLLCLTFVP